MGLEESYGYLVGDHARDKDAVSAVMMIVEMCAYYKSKGQGLVEALENLYKKYGYYKTELASFQYPGKEGMTTMAKVIGNIRNNPPAEILGKAVEFTDFATGVDGLPISDVLRFRNDEIRLIVRPSGTEPKLKIYYQVKGETGAKADEKMQQLIAFSKARLFS
jgi:phosphoglucomutase